MFALKKGQFYLPIITQDSRLKCRAKTDPCVSVPQERYSGTHLRKKLYNVSDRKVSEHRKDCCVWIYVATDWSKSPH